MVLTTDNIFNPFDTSDNQGYGLGSSSRMKRLLDESALWTEGLKTQDLGSGTVTIQTTTNTYDVDYDDIAIDVGDLDADDIVKIEVLLHNPGDKGAEVRIDINGVTTPVSSTTFVISNAKYGQAIFTFTQHPTLSDRVIYNKEGTDNVTHTAKTDGLDTDEANVFSSDFTFRVNCRFLTQPAAATTTVRWSAYAIKG